MSIDRIKNFLSKVVKKSDNGRQGSRELIGGKADTSPLTPEKVQQYIEEFLPVRKEEKDKFGEVFTPQSLINEMLDKLPKNVWSDPTLKWLDPANGIGNFPMVAFVRLDKGLSNVDGFKDKKVRQKHIIQNMLYMVELNPKNVGVSRRIFGKDANIYCGSFLDDGWKRKFGVDKFDVIIGNPPYNAGDVGRSGEKRLDISFIIKSFSILQKKGYLLFITKTNWRSLTEHKIRETLKDKTILNIKTYDFNANPFSENVLTNYFLIKNVNNDTKTLFEFLTNKKLFNNKGIINLCCNIYFLYLPYLNNLAKLKNKYGNMKNIIRTIPDNNEDILISHRKDEIILAQDALKDIKSDQYYVIKRPNKIEKYFFLQSGIFNDMRYKGRFTGFATSKALFLDIPNFKNVEKENENLVLNILKNISLKLNNSKQDQKGGMKRSTRKISKNILKTQQKTRKYKVQRNKRNTRKNKRVQRRRTKKNKSKRK